MRAVIQRVIRASVTVEGEVVGAIDRGLCVLIGICNGDTKDDADFLVRKLVGIRLFDDNDQPWKQSVVSAGLEILCVSQFTLYAKTSKGNKPDFHHAMSGETSKGIFDGLVSEIKAAYEPEMVKEGQFGANMAVEIVNDGPVTIILDSNQKDPAMKMPLVE